MKSRFIDNIFALCGWLMTLYCTLLNAQTSHKTRLPDEISKHQPTILPILTSDGKRLYFDRKHHPDNSGRTSDYDEIWFSDRLSNGTWSKPTSIGAPLNTMGSDVLCSLSPDDRTALVYGVYDKELPVKTEGFSITHQHKGAWQFPTPIRIQNFYNRAKKYYARLAPDNRTLLLALQRDDALGGLDLYVSFRKESREIGANTDTTLEWTEPKHLGNVVNTGAYEGSPHLAADGKTLYFSSEGLGGSGVADLFVSRRLDDTWQKWSKPENLGNSINTREEDSAIDVSLDGMTAFFVSSNDDIGTDTTNAKGIFTATLPDSLRHTGSMLLSGNVSVDSYLQRKYNISQSSRILIQAFRVNIENGKLVQTLVSLTETTVEESKYALSLPADTRYYVKANVVGFADVPLFRTVVDTRLENNAKTRFERKTVNIAFGASTLTFPPVRFAQEQSTVLPEYNAVLAWIADEAVSVRSSRLSITGHTCDLGTDEENDELSMSRAEAVAALLESFGVEHAQMLIRGRGEKEPLERSQMDDARVKNRRVEIVLKRGK